MQGSWRQTKRACYSGYLTQGIINSLTPLLFTVFQDSYHLNFAQLSQLIVLNFGTQLCMDIFSVFFVDRIGMRRCLTGSHLLAAGGLVLMGILPRVVSPFGGIAFSVVCCGMGSGLIEDLVSPILDSLPDEHKSSSMSMLHSFYCWGQVAVIAGTTLALHFLGSSQWYLLPICWAVIPAVNLIRFLRVPLAPALPPEEKTPISSLLHSRLYLLCLVLMLCAGAAELSMSQWSSLFAERGLGVPKMTGDLLGPCLFALLEGMGRLLYGLYGDKWNLHQVLLWCSVSCAGCYVLMALARLPLLSLMGCALCGFTVSLMWPGMYSLSSHSFPHGGTSMFGLLAVFGDIGCSAGPWLTGLFGSGEFGLRQGLLAATAFPAVMVVGMLCFCYKAVRQQEKTPNED
ncbi:MAG: MFS transporter [Oscillospiraceae bacterium]|nr:MFS transporter [Oscillospiraceae bacterium]